MFRLSLILAASILLFFSCKKDEDLPVAPGDRLKMLRYKDGDSIWSRSFQYDVHDRLISAFDSAHLPILDWIVNYDSQGKLLNIVVRGEVFTFDFDNKGRVIRKKTTLPGQQSATVLNSYGYDVDDRLILDSIYGYSSPDAFGFISYIYDDNNNVVETKTTTIGGGTQVLRQATYDNHPNPLYSQSGIFYFLFDTYGFSSPPGKNNLLKEKDTSGNEANFHYEYYSNGLPKRYTLSYRSSPRVYEVEYYYE